MLHVVPFQLRLFPDYHDAYSRIGIMGPESRARRTAHQWLASVEAYLTWRAGDCWRNLSKKEERNEADRWDYVAGLRLVGGVRYLLPGPALVSRVESNPVLSPEIQRLANRPRGELVSELVSADPALTDRKLLSHLSGIKLASMLADRRRRRRECA